MQRLKLPALALSATLAAAQFASAQVIGTYRPSVVTYYPTSTSVLPAASQPQIAQASYYGASTVASPIATVSGTQYLGGPIATQSYYASPVATGGCGCGCGCTPAPVAYTQPIAYSAPVAAPVQTVSYAQPGLGANRYIGSNIFGNPKVYATGQPLRNALRWLGP